MMPSSRSRTAVVDGPSAPAFASITRSHRLPGIAARPAHPQAVPRTDGCPPRAPRVSMLSSGTARLVDALLPTFGIERAKLLGLLILVKGDRGAVGPIEQRHFVQRLDQRALAVAAVEPGHRRDAGLHAIIVRQRKQIIPVLFGKSCHQSCPGREPGEPVASHQRLGQPGGDFEILAWSPRSVGQRQLPHAAPLRRPDRARSSPPGVQSALGGARLGAGIAQPVIGRCGREVLADVDALRRVAGIGASRASRSKPSGSSVIQSPLR